MGRQYTILRDMGGMPSGEVFGGGTRGIRGASADSVPELKLESEDLTKRDLADLNRDRTVVGVAPIMPTRLIQPFTADSDPSLATTWGISAVGADESRFDGAGIRVSILDTGIDADHAAFNGVELIEKDFSGSGNGDVQGHGTHCAGTVFGRDVDGIRIGVARGVETALIGKVLGDDGGGSSDMIFRGIQWSVNEGANVISMSLGFDFPGLVDSLVKGGWPADLATSVALESYRANLRMFDSLMDLIRAGAPFGREVSLVAAAGNESQRQVDEQYEISVSLPAAADGVISVGAVENDTDGMRIADFSNTLPQISGPGVGVLSAKPGGGLRALSGTSMATPHVAGCAALWMQSLTDAGISVSATNVVAKMLANARSDVFAEDVDIADRGVGLVSAP